MSSDLTNTSERDEQLRRLLVATATAEPVTTPKRSRAVFGSIIAFSLAGALTGGAISAAALTWEVNSTPTSISIDDMTQRVVRDDTQLFGTPFIIRSSGVTDIDLGEAPAGATSIVLAFHCVTAGTFERTLDGEPAGSYTCTDDDTDLAVGGGFQEPVKSGSHTLRISADNEASYVIWVSWAAPAPKAQPSPAQLDAMSDGVASEAEYREGFARYSACMADAGHTIAFVDDSGIIIDYSNTADSVTSGDEARCYATEFEQLDIAWQIQHEEQTQ